MLNFPPLTKLSTIFVSHRESSYFTHPSNILQKFAIFLNAFVHFGFIESPRPQNYISVQMNRNGFLILKLQQLSYPINCKKIKWLEHLLFASPKKWHLALASLNAKAHKRKGFFSLSSVDHVIINNMCIVLKSS